MKFTAPAEALRGALSKVSSVIEGRNVIPILASVRVEATGSAVNVSASSYELSITATIEAAVEEPGVACIPAAELIRLVGLARKAGVQIETSERSATVSFGRTSAELKTYKPAEFPPLPDYEGLDMQDVDGDVLARGLKFAAVAMSDEETRYHLMGVHLMGRDGGAIATGTDGHRLHRATMPTLPIEGVATIPAKHVVAICGIISDGGRVRVAIGERFWAVATDTVKARGSVVDGVFPDADRLIREAEISAIVDRDELREAVEIAATGAGKTDKTVHVVVDISGDEIGIRGFKPGDALAKGVSTALAAETKAPILGTYNSAYLHDTLRALDCDRVAILDAGTLIVHVEPVEPAVEIQFKAIVMGIRATMAEMAA